MASPKASRAHADLKIWLEPKPFRRACSEIGPEGSSSVNKWRVTRYTDSSFHSPSRIYAGWMIRLVGWFFLTDYPSWRMIRLQYKSGQCVVLELVPLKGWKNSPLKFGATPTKQDLGTSQFFFFFFKNFRWAPSSFLHGSPPPGHNMKSNKKTTIIFLS